MIKTDDREISENDILIKFKKYLKIMEYNDIGIFEWNKFRGINFSNNLKQKFGFNSALKKSIFDIKSFIFKDDAENYDKFFERIKNGEEFSQLVCRVKNCSDFYIWCEISVITDSVKNNDKIELEYIFGMIRIIDKDDKAFKRQILEKANIEAEMYDALERRQFFMYLQPKYNLKNRNIVGAEALVRWKRNENSFLLPEEFLPAFEENGFIIKLDEYIWEEACRILRKWIDMGFAPIPVSVNVSRRQIFNPDFIGMLLWLTEKYQISHSLIGLELPESVFINNSDAVCEILKKVKKYGFFLEMDDFGSGYSSLKMLKNVNVDIIKIDKEFLDETVSKKGRIVLKHTITMAKELNLKVIAEGVENEEQICFLNDCGCDTAQGFYFSKPLSVNEFEYKAFYKC